MLNGLKSFKPEDAVVGLTGNYAIFCQHRPLMRLLDAIKSSSDYLEKAGIEDPFADAELLVLHVSEIDRLAAYVDNPEIGHQLLSKIRRLITRRARGEPVQYLTGHVEFLGLTIKVGKGLLIPRPETELLAEEAINELRTQNSAVSSQGLSTFNPNPLTFRILDLCTGSGCISLALAKEFPDAYRCGTDISKIAIRYAKKNAVLNGISNVNFFTGSLFEPAGKDRDFDLIISNPPYVKTAEIDVLQREIREWEPLNALDGGMDGLDFYRRIFSEAGNYLKKNGKVIIELGYDQAVYVAEIAEQCDFRNISVKKDYAGIKRILKAER
jgi:release factor glutamine methyltransferase